MFYFKKLKLLKNILTKIMINKKVNILCKQFLSSNIEEISKLTSLF